MSGQHFLSALGPSKPAAEGEGTGTEALSVNGGSAPALSRPISTFPSAACVSGQDKRSSTGMREHWTLSRMVHFPEWEGEEGTYGCRSMR